MITSKHCKMRQQQRGIRSSQITEVIQSGTLIGGDLYWMRNQDCIAKPDCKSFLNLVVIVGGETVVTAYRADKAEQKRLSLLAKNRGSA